MHIPRTAYETSPILSWRYKQMKMDLSTSQLIVLVLVGLMAGVLSGFVGIGGGVVIVPALIYFLSLNQLQAQGVTLAVLVMPVGILGVMNYYKAGNVNFNYALIIAAGFVIGSFFGSKYALKLPDYKVKFIFALLMIYMGISMLWKSGVKWFGPQG